MVAWISFIVLVLALCITLLMIVAIAAFFEGAETDSFTSGMVGIFASIWLIGLAVLLSFTFTNIIPLLDSAGLL